MEVNERILRDNIKELKQSLNEQSSPSQRRKPAGISRDGKPTFLFSLMTPDQRRQAQEQFALYKAGRDLKEMKRRLRSGG